MSGCRAGAVAGRLAIMTWRGPRRLAALVFACAALLSGPGVAALEAIAHLGRAPAHARGKHVESRDTPNHADHCLLTAPSHGLRSTLPRAITFRFSAAVQGCAHPETLTPRFAGLSHLPHSRAPPRPAV